MMQGLSLKLYKPKLSLEGGDVGGEENGEKREKEAEGENIWKT